MMNERDKEEEEMSRSMTKKNRVGKVKGRLSAHTLGLSNVPEAAAGFTEIKMMEIQKTGNNSS